MTATAFRDVDIPDETPQTEGSDFDPDFPGSTADAPYGYKPDGTPYKRRPNGKGSGGGTSTGARRMPASDNQARTAANLLATLNNLVGASIHIFGMEMTAEQLHKANEQFAELAYEALKTDPALCRKILATGATGGKVGLITAYSMLALNIYPTAHTEIREKRAERQAQREAEFNE